MYWLRGCRKVVSIQPCLSSRVCNKPMSCSLFPTSRYLITGLCSTSLLRYAIILVRCTSAGFVECVTTQSYRMTLVVWWSRTWVGLFFMLAWLPCRLSQIPLAQAQLGRLWNIQNSGQPNPGPRALGSPLRLLLLFFNFAH